MNKLPLLIVEDDRAIAYSLKHILSENYDVSVSYSVQDALYQIEHNSYDCYLLDIRLPDGTGFEVCEFIRNRTDSAILFLTVEDEESDVVKGLELGADDYIIKPFRSKELMSRISNVIRRKESSVVKINDIIINTQLATVYKDEDSINLSSNEYKLLLFLVRNANTIITRESLYQILWDTDEFVNSNSLTVTIRRLRTKLGDSIVIETIHGRGYVLLHENTAR